MGQDRDYFQDEPELAVYQLYRGYRTRAWIPGWSGGSQSVVEFVFGIFHLSYQSSEWEVGTGGVISVVRLRECMVRLGEAGRIFRRGLVGYSTGTVLEYSVIRCPQHRVCTAG